MKNIILVGYMGSGKSTIGKSIAKLKGYTFVDTDSLIEEQAGITINEIFAQKGEQAFRDMETRLLGKLVENKKEGFVVSTGGGMPLREQNRELLNKLGAVVYLKASPDVIYERLEGDNTRPLLQCENPRRKIADMINERGPIYEESASIIVNVDELTQSDAADEIIRKVNKR